MVPSNSSAPRCFLSIFTVLPSLFTFHLLPSTFNFHCPDSLRPVRRPVVAGAGELGELLAVPRDRIDLHFARARRRKRQMPSIGRKRGTLIAAFATGDLMTRTGGDIVNPDIKAGSAARGVRDLVERSRRPGGAVRVRVLERESPHVQPISVHDPDLR